MAAAAVATGIAAGKVVFAQDASPAQPSLPTSGRSGQPGARGPLTLPDSLIATPDPGRTPPAIGGSPRPSTSTGSVPRTPLRQKRPRRSRPPTVAQVQSDFRPTLAPPGVVPEVQPIQTGLPDAGLPGAGLPGSGLPGSGPLAATPLRKRPIEDDPYAPVGVRVGNINLFPVVGESIGYDTNPNRVQYGVKSSFVSQTEGELKVQSDWSRHELTGLLRGAYYDYASNSPANRPEGAGQMNLRLDVLKDTQVNIGGRFQIDTQRPGSPDLNVNVRSRPNLYSEGASVEGVQRLNRVVLSLRGSVDRYDYEDARLSDGTILSQADRNLTAYGLRARIGYELKPGLVPFVQGDVDTRDYDNRLDSAGYARSSDGLGGRVGTTFEITRLLTGEISVGALDRKYADRRLGDLTSPVGDLSLAYAFSPITTIRAGAQVGIDETTIPGANGVRSYRGTIDVTHDLRRNLTLTTGLSFVDYEYQGANITETGFGAVARLDYRLNRNVTLRASYSYDQLHSTAAGSSYATNTFLVGLRLQP